MDIASYNRDLFAFLRKSPTPFHAVSNIAEFLSHQGYIPLRENERWNLLKGNGYFVTRDQGAILAFVLGAEECPEDGFRMMAAHTDSPCLQIKPHADVTAGSFRQLGVEVYGGSLLAPWFDRDLSLAGRICFLDNEGKLQVLLTDFHRPLLFVPSIAIHMEREANKNGGINQQKHLPPALAQSIHQQLPGLNSLTVKQIQQENPSVTEKDVLSFDLFCYDVQPPTFTGLNQEFISASRLDNLVSCHIGMYALGFYERKKNCLLFCANHEEIGSTSMSGAQGSFVDAVLERLFPEVTSRRIALSNSFLISMDNAHATHPNYPEKSDPTHEIHLNKGPVIKVNANQRYATNALSAAIFKNICHEAGVSPQEFAMRSDMPCGSTIGPMTAARLGVRTVDVGIASLAMHSIREHTGSSDPYLLLQAVSYFLRSDSHRQLLF